LWNMYLFNWNDCKVFHVLDFAVQYVGAKFYSGTDSNTGQKVRGECSQRRPLLLTGLPDIRQSMTIEATSLPDSREIKPLPVSSSSSDDSEGIEEKPLVHRRRSRPSSRTEIKTEEAPTTILASSGPQVTPLRRRRSKIVDPVSSDSSES